MPEKVKSDFYDYFMILPINPTNDMIIAGMECLLQNFIEVEDVSDINYRILTELFWHAMKNAYIEEINQNDD